MDRRYLIICLNDEARMSNDERMTKSEAVGRGRAGVLEEDRKE